MTVHCHEAFVRQLSYAVLHLATRHDDRERMLADPRLIPHALEELLRSIPIVRTNFDGAPHATSQPMST
jgi:cytochrome P450